MAGVSVKSMEGVCLCRRLLETVDSGHEATGYDAFKSLGFQTVGLRTVHEVLASFSDASSESEPVLSPRMDQASNTTEQIQKINDTGRVTRGR